MATCLDKVIKNDTITVTKASSKQYKFVSQEKIYSLYERVSNDIVIWIVIAGVAVCFIFFVKKRVI